MIAGECVSGSQETVDNVPTAVVDMMHIVSEHAAVEACCSVNWLEVLRMNVQSANRHVESVQQEAVEVEKSPYLSRAAVGQGKQSVNSPADTEHLL